MDLIRFSEFLVRGLGSKSERGFLLALGILSLFYVATLAYFDVADIPVNKSFFAQRDAVRIAHALADPLPINQLVAISDGSTVTPHVAILEGWSVPEPLGVWTDAKVADAAFAIPKVNGQAMLLLGLHIMLDRQDKQSLQLYGNGQLLGDWKFTAGLATLQIPLRMGFANSAKLLKLEFVIGDPVRPIGSGDPRMLGIFLNTIEIETGGSRDRS